MHPFFGAEIEEGLRQFQRRDVLGGRILGTRIQSADEKNLIKVNLCAFARSEGTHRSDLCVGNSVRSGELEVDPVTAEDDTFLYDLL